MITVKVQLIFRSENAWFGLIPGESGPCDCGTAGSQQCIDCRKSWDWYDGSHFDYDTFHDWHGREPNGGEECARLAQGGWLGRGCSHEYNYVICSMYKNIGCKMFSTYIYHQH